MLGIQPRVHHFLPPLHGQVTTSVTRSVSAPWPPVCVTESRQLPMRMGNLTTKEHLGGGRWGDAHARSPLLHKSNGVALRILPRFHSQGLGSAPPFQPHFKLLSLCALLSFLLAPQDLGTPPPPLTSPLYRQELGLRVLQALVDSHFLFVRAHGAQHR